MKKIAIIPARSGSKGLKNKNILNVLGKPLLGYTIEAAIRSTCFDKIYVSTDSEQYGNIAKEYGVEVIMRDEECSNDYATTYDVLRDAFNKIDCELMDYFVLLQPTSPLRTEKHIREAIELFEKEYKNKNALVSITESSKASALIKEVNEQTLSLENFNLDYSRYRRQNNKEYEPNGAIFISKINYYVKAKHFFGNTSIGYIMDSYSSLDIDSIDDFEILLKRIKDVKTNKIKDSYVLKRFKEKIALLNTNSKESRNITFIGDSILEGLDLNIEKTTLNNLALKGVTAKQYNDVVFKSNLIKSLSREVFVLIGINDIKQGNNVVQETVKLIKNLKRIGTNYIYYIPILNVNGRADIDNEYIEYVNKIICEEIKNDCIILSTELFKDNYKWLKMNLTCDGLHLNKDGYTVLENIIRGALYEKDSLCNGF